MAADEAADGRAALDTATLAARARGTATHDVSAGTADATHGPVFGLDVGTTHTVVALAEPGRVRCVPMVDGSPLLPSIAAYAPGGDVRVGPDAVELATYAKGAVLLRQMKRILGLRAADPQVATDTARWDADVGADIDGDAIVRVPGVEEGTTRVITPAQVATCVLTTARDAVRAHTGHALTRALVTVPCYFSAAQCVATRDACAAAGIAVTRLMREPEAAAHAMLATLTGAAAFTPGPLLVFDWGGGTCDVAIMRLAESCRATGAPAPVAAAAAAAAVAAEGEQGDVDADADADATGGAALSLRADGGARLAEEMDVLASVGDGALGGMDMDLALLRAAGAALCARHAEDPAVAAAVHTTLHTPAAMAEALLCARKVKERLLHTDSVAACVRNWPPLTVTPRMLAAAVAPLIARAVGVARSAVVAAGLREQDVVHVAYVGGVTRMPAVRDAMQRAFTGARHHDGIPPDTIVAHGAAVVAAREAGTFAGALVALGTAAAGVSVPLGIAAANGMVHPLVPEGALADRRVVATNLSTRGNQQSTVALTVVRGFAPLARGCEPVGTLVLGFEPPLPAGVHQITVQGTPLSTGALRVEARETISGAVARGTFDGAVLYNVPRERLQSEKRAAADMATAHALNFQRERRCTLLENCIASTRRMLLEPGALPESDAAMWAVRARLDGILQDAEGRLTAFRIAGTEADVDDIADALSTLSGAAAKVYREHIEPAKRAAAAASAHSE